MIGRMRKVAPTSMMIRGALHHGKGIGEAHGDTIRKVLLTVAFIAALICISNMVISVIENYAAIEHVRNVTATCNAKIAECNSMLRNCGKEPIEYNASKNLEELEKIIGGVE